MRIATFNVENLFDRAKALNVEDWSIGRPILEQHVEINDLFEKPTYAAADLARMRALIVSLGLENSDTGPYVQLRQIRGRLLSRPRAGGITFKAKGRGDWVGWAELRSASVNETAIMNTGRVIRDVGADVLGVVEVEDRIVLKAFSESVLPQIGGTPYTQVMVIDGNDARGIDVGLLLGPGYELDLMRSHIHDLKPDGAPVFSRDCPEYAVRTPSGETVWFLVNHFKSKGYGSQADSDAKRRAQASHVAEFYRRLRADGYENVVVLGDLNDTPDSDPLAPLLRDTDLKDIWEHAGFDTGEWSGRGDDKGRGTYGLGNDSNKIDYLLLSPALFARASGGGLFRKGAWPGSRPPRWSVYPELTKKIHIASDHHALWADVDI
jgi:endonuclease/exonuclease/phosphatase family metal-dependent hydrolase